MQVEMKKDKLITNENCFLVVLDLENVITLQKAKIILPPKKTQAL